MHEVSRQNESACVCDRNVEKEYLPSLCGWWKKRIRYRWMLLTFKRRLCFEFLSNRINSLLIHFLFWRSSIHEAWHCLQDWNTISREQLKNAKCIPSTHILCWQTIEQMQLLPFRGRFHGFEWRERNSVCQQFQPKCTQWWTEWNYVRSGMRIVAVETSIWVATLIRFPIWIAKCTWWFQLALASLNHPSETKKKERERKMRLLLFIAFHFHLFQTSVFHSIPFCAVWALKMVFWVHLLIYGTYRQWWRKCRKRRKERCASASTLLPLKRSS